MHAQIAVEHVRRRNIKEPAGEIYSRRRDQNRNEARREKEANPVTLGVHFPSVRNVLRAYKGARKAHVYTVTETSRLAGWAYAHPLSESAAIRKRANKKEMAGSAALKIRA